jgi:putative transposase
MLDINDLWVMVASVREKLPQMFDNIILDQFVVMPNHIHGIIGFYWVPFSHFTKKATTLGNIIKRFKLETLWDAKKWWYENILKRQKSFYDHVIRNQKDLERIQEYIINNPLQRELDILNKNNDREYQERYDNLQS